MSRKNNQNLTYGDQQLPTYGVICNRDLKFINSRINYPSFQVRDTVSLKNIINPRTSCKNSFGKMWYPHKFIDVRYNPSIGGYVNANGPIGPYFAQGLGNYPRSMYKQVFFGTHSRSRSPTKYKDSKEHILNEQSTIELEEQSVQQLLNDPEVYVGDYIVILPNNQMGVTKRARIFKDRQGNKIIGRWRYEYPEGFDDYYFGKRKSVKRKTTSPKRKIKSPKRKTTSPKRKIIYCLPKEQKYPVNTKKRCSAALSYARYAKDPCQIARCVQRHCAKYPTVGTYSKLIEECKRKSRKSRK